MNSLTSKEVTEILHFLEVPEAPPTFSTLQNLIRSYVLKIPWESISRIVRKKQVDELMLRPRWPAEFWKLSMTQGTGGTCFESNYAFWKLLEALGFHGYLTINDMGETRACHSAIVIETQNNQDTTHYLVDVGLPLYTAIPLQQNYATTATSDYQHYSIQPLTTDATYSTYLIHRNPHPRPTAYTLIDQGIPEEEYIEAVIRDYDEDGLFLDTAVMTKVVNGVISRFSTHDRPYSLELFESGERKARELPHDLTAAASEIGQYFSVPSTLVYEALMHVDQNKSD
jgi:arylamine N-acetyltransferase